MLNRFHLRGKFPHALGMNNLPRLAKRGLTGDNFALWTLSLPELQGSHQGSTLYRVPFGLQTATHLGRIKVDVPEFSVVLPVRFIHHFFTKSTTSQLAAEHANSL
jgi:hypothetical protein